MNYEGWWGHDTLPKLNYEDSVKLENYILGIGKKWVSPPYNVDGWRLDVAADLGQSNEYNHRFWKKFRQVVKKRIRTRLSWQNIMEIQANGFRATSGIRL